MPSTSPPACGTPVEFLGHRLEYNKPAAGTGRLTRLREFLSRQYRRGRRKAPVIKGASSPSPRLRLLHARILSSPTFSPHPEEPRALAPGVSKEG